MARLRWGRFCMPCSGRTSLEPCDRQRHRNDGPKGRAVTSSSTDSQSTIQCSTTHSMADPLSIIAGVSGTIMFGLHASRKAYELIDGIRDAPQEVRDISKDVKAFGEVLAGLQGTLKDDFNSVDNGAAADILQSLQVPLNNCIATLEDLTDRVRKKIKPSGDSETSKWRGLAWMFKKNEVKTLQDRLVNGKLTLGMALMTLNRLHNAQVHKNTDMISKHVQELRLELRAKDTEHVALESLDGHPGSQHGTDVGFALNRFLESMSMADAPDDVPSSPDLQPSNWADPSHPDDDVDSEGDLGVPEDHSGSRFQSGRRNLDEAEVKRLLQTGTDVNAHNSEGETALHLAAIWDEQLTQLVLDNGADVNVRNVDSETALMCAIRADNWETMKLLLQRGADVNALTDEGRSALHYAATSSLHEGTARFLLAKSANIEARDEDGRTPLYAAALVGNAVVARVLLERGAMMHAPEAKGWTALHYTALRDDSALMGRLLRQDGPDVEAFYEVQATSLRDGSTTLKRKAEVARLLLEKGADIEATPDHSNWTPLRIAALGAQEVVVRLLLFHGARAEGVSILSAIYGLTVDITRWLLERGASVDLVDSRHRKTALTWAAEAGKVEMVSLFLLHGASVSSQDRYWDSALHYAAANARIEIVAQLLSKGADPNLPDRDKGTSLHRVAQIQNIHLANNVEIVPPASRVKTARLLIDAGADVTARDAFDATALHYAAGNDYLDLVKLLVSQGSDVHAKDNHGRSPLAFAQERGHGVVVRFLKKNSQLSSSFIDVQEKTPVHDPAQREAPTLV